MNTPNTNSAVFPKYFIYLIPIVCLLIISFDFSPFKLTIDTYAVDTEEDCCDITEKPTKMIFTFDNDGTCQVPPYQDATCSGVISLSPNPVYIIVHSSIKENEILFSREVYNGNSFMVDATGVTVNDKFPPKITILIKKSAVGDVLQTVTMHTSCSQPLIPGERFGSIVINKLITIKKNGTVLECGVHPPPWPICEIKTNQRYWSNTITITDGGDNITAPVFFKENLTDTAVINFYPDNNIPKNATIELDSFAAWYANTQATVDQPNQRFKLLFCKDDEVIMSTEFTAGDFDDGIHVNAQKTSDEWVGVPNIEGFSANLSDSVNNIKLAQYPNGGAVYPVSICLYFTANALPIRLLTFEANVLENNQVELHWATATETDNNYFELLRSPNGLSYVKIETMEGAGTSSEVLDYRCIDKNPYIGYNYYKLKQVDMDGKFTYSDVVMVMVMNKFDDEININIFPNPTKTSLNFQIEKPLHAGGEIQLIDLLGKVIHTSELVGGLNTVIKNEIDVSQLADGIYYLKVQADQWMKVTPFEIIK